MLFFFFDMGAKVVPEDFDRGLVICICGSEVLEFVKEFLDLFGEKWNVSTFCNDRTVACISLCKRRSSGGGVSYGLMLAPVLLSHTLAARHPSFHGRVDDQLFSDAVAS